MNSKNPKYVITGETSDDYDDPRPNKEWSIENESEAITAMILSAQQDKKALIEKCMAILTRTEALLVRAQKEYPELADRLSSEADLVKSAMLTMCNRLQ
jgi:hypothetical protein